MCKRLFAGSITFVIASWLAGCTTTTVEDGWRPPIQNLSTLVVGRSSVADVQSALGVPRGSGKIKHSKDVEARDIIYYEFVQIKGNQVGLKLLLVFLKDDVYDGHLWFGANELIEKQL